MRVADFIANFIHEKKIETIFMLTGYGSMFMNDAIHLKNIKHISPRNEATAPVMALGYSRISGNVGVVCVTAGPGATNALPGLAEAYVESAPILILSGQVERRFTSTSNSLNLRTYGTAEIDIINFVKNHTKYSAFINDPNLIKYELEKAFHFCTNGRPGPVWLDIPLDVQNKIIEIDNMDSFEPKIKKPKKQDYLILDKIINNLNNSTKPIIIIGHGAKISNTSNELINFCRKYNFNFALTRFTNDIIDHNENLCLGVLGEKGQRYSKLVFNETDYVLSLGCRLAPTFTGENYNFFFPKAKIDYIDLDQEELNKFNDYTNFDNLLNLDLRFLPDFLSSIKNKLQKNRNDDWSKFINKVKTDYKMISLSMQSEPLDLYYFMSQLEKYSNKNTVFISDAGSNYYIGGQVWNFKNNEREISSTSNAAMGISLPLAIGAASADKKLNVLAVTGDGSIELNIQELKTMSHYNCNIKLFVINNGGYASMRNWQDKFGSNNRLDTAKLTGVGTLDFKNISKAFSLPYQSIKSKNQLNSKLNKIIQNKGPMLIEVCTKIDQEIVIPYELEKNEI